MAILIILLVISICFSIFCLTRKKKIDKTIQEKNNQLFAENLALSKDNEKLLKDFQITQAEISTNNKLIQEKQEEIDRYNSQLNLQTEKIKNGTEIVNQALEYNKKISQEAYDNFWKVLDNKYNETQQEYDYLIEGLEKAYSELQLKLMAEADECRADLDKIKSTRAAAIEAARREKEIESDLSFYCIDISDTDKADIAKLESLKPSLNKPRILSMLIWTTFVRDQLKALTNNIIGAGDKTGIYKITNIVTKECYIGQARSVRERWTEHCKAGLGIDTPAANQLYKAMSDYGIWNFSFELLEECPTDQLNEKEKYYINLYDSYNFGYNKNKGVGK